MNLNLIAQVVVYGLIPGSLYALLGTSWNLIYHTTRTFDFAHATVFVTAAYAFLLLTVNAGLPFVAAGILGVVAAVLLGTGMEVLVYRRFRRIGATLFVIFIAALGMSILGESLIHILFTAAHRRFEGFTIVSLHLGQVTFTNLHVLEVVVSAIAITAVYLYMTRTRAGKTIRAVACNPDMAQVVGISKDATFVLAFALGSGLMGLSAVLWTMEKGGVLPFMGMEPLFKSFIVAIIGGIGSIPGAVAGGLILGVAENLGLLVLPAEMKSIVAFIVLIIFLIVRPTGLFPSEVRKLI
ncbi:MAG: branched-chain amino acid ABC transporter permease [Dehalococcoidia bacterium]|nr:MAG: branched-chain amino acid ABC transporter permease [Dehalococcoidia bacterium]